MQQVFWYFHSALHCFKLCSDGTWDTRWRVTSIVWDTWTSTVGYLHCWDDLKNSGFRFYIWKTLLPKRQLECDGLPHCYYELGVHGIWRRLTRGSTYRASHEVSEDAIQFPWDVKASHRSIEDHPFYDEHPLSVRCCGTSVRLYLYAAFLGLAY